MDLILFLPDHLRERARVAGVGPREPGEMVLYWMRTAWRGHENPALDVAMTMARVLSCPLFVVQDVPADDPYASDRHHTFLLEGARDAAAELTMLGVSHALHVARAPADPSPVPRLAARAALVVTEDAPVTPHRERLRRLTETCVAPVWAVDTACIVPMQRQGRAFDRAWRFREATRALFAERIGRAWPPPPAPSSPFCPEALGFAPVDLSQASIADVVAGCAIDHTIAPVAHTRGGARAGYARWGVFRDDHLPFYARRRNDPLLPNAVSRLSPYLSRGQISPFRIAREAHLVGGDGARKFLDELLIWRELSHGWCFHRADHDALSALPDWARATLDRHRDDPRPMRVSLERLARAASGDTLWDAAQRSLLIHGELHNNVRMTWGKAIAAWTESAERWLAALIDLNHRYALDGNDPNSYGGLLWCLGLFDRPFSPEAPIIGTLRPRPTAGHAARLDVDAYRRLTGRPALAKIPRVAVIGGGMAGLVCARALVDHAVAVTVFDKGRRPGGRLASRRIPAPGNELFNVDHGAQYVTASDRRFCYYLKRWLDDGRVAPWTEPIAILARDGGATDRPRFVGVPSMNALAAYLAEDVDVRASARIVSVARCGGGWFVTGDDGAETGPFDRMVIAVPAPQAAPLIVDAAPHLADALDAVSMAPCWAAMLAFDRPLETPFAAAVGDGPIAWMARNGSKPGRHGEAWVVHASADWSRRTLEADADAIAGDLAAIFADAVGARGVVPTHRAAHRWRFARVERPLGEPCLYDADLGLGLCGDWCLGARVEAAWLSGAALAGRLLGDAADTSDERISA